MDQWLFSPFYSWDASVRFIDSLKEQGYTRSTLFALEGVLQLEEKVRRGQLAATPIRNFLSKWRNKTTCFNYTDKFFGQTVYPFLRNLKSFNEFGVPLFIDDYGDKRVLSDFSELEVLNVDFLNDIICHVTHEEEARRIIMEKKLVINEEQEGFRSSNHKNVLKGCWFSLEKDGETVESRYGSYTFETTLDQLATNVYLRQGEVVTYKEEVNVILYVDHEPDDDPLLTPTLRAAQELLQRNRGYINVSIFVPERFLPSTPGEFDEAIQCGRVAHNGFCVRERRSQYVCNEVVH